MIPSFLRPLTSRLRPWYLPLVFRSPPQPAEDSISGLVLPHISTSDVVYEVGANIGAASLALARRAALVFAFEPNPEAFAYLSRYSKRAPRKNIIPVKLGLSNKSERVPLHVQSLATPSKISSLGKLRNMAYDRELVVNLERVDSFIRDLPPSNLPSVIVVDCEGEEEKVLLGAELCLQGVKQVFVETHYLENGDWTMPAVKKILQEKGFVVESNYVDEDGMTWVHGSKFLRHDNGATDAARVHVH